MHLSLNDPAATKRVGAKLAAILRAGDVVALYGGLGAGKTTLSRGVIQAALGEHIDIPSPTYNLVNVYEGAIAPIWHFDLYRLNTVDEVFELGWDDTDTGICLIEWPENAGAHLPNTRLDITLEIRDDARTVQFTPHGEIWERRLHDWT